MITLGLVLNLFLGFLVLVYWTVVFIILYHLTRFGVGVQPKKFAAVFLIGTVILFTVAISLYMNVDISKLI
jgi:hypothetical protein